jgi:huntingtin interacting protein 1
MATRPMQRVLNPRNRSTSLDIEKENFEKSQMASISKAINYNESPVKEKHVRRIIIGTFKTKSAQLFWSIVRTLPLQENPIVCWKFCHVLHKLLREGYRKTIPDSYPFRSMILDLGKMWGLLKEGYGKLIQNYCTLLVNKIDFHARNQRFPGNLMVSDEELENIGEHDVNVFFQLSCEIFDYLDEILCLQTNVFGSLDMSRSNSMTNQGQCRLAPLIPCIQDSSQLYDYSVKVLFKLHAALPPGTLDGHRNRFLNQFKILKLFYLNSKNLQYFKNLIQVPLLPDEPPNFLIQSDLDSHVTPVVILPQHSESPENESIDMNLVDLSFTNSNDSNSEKFDDSASMWSFRSDHRNGSLSPSIIEEKDRIIQRLMARIQELELEMQQLRIEDGRKIDDLKRSIAELECATAQRMEKEIELLKLELERQKSSSDAQSEIAKVTDKFTKMKDIYNKLRAEHIELLRNKAETDRQLSMTKTNLDELNSIKTTLETQLKEHVKKEAEFSSMSLNNNELKLQIETNQNQLKQYNASVETLKHEKCLLEEKVNYINSKNSELHLKIDEMQKLFLEKLKNREWELMNLVITEMQTIAKRIANEDIESGSISVNCSPEYFFVQLETLSKNLTLLEESTTSIASNHSVEKIMISVIRYYYQLSYSVNCAKVTYQTIPNIELGQVLMNRCKELVHLSFKVSEGIKTKSDLSKPIDELRQCLHQLIAMNVLIIPALAADKTKDLEKLLMDEISDMDRAIQDAANKIEQMILLAKSKDTGIKLEVNGKILDACTYLMAAIKELIHDSKELQKEIVSQGKGVTSMKEFYQRNHRWTEGLISAAKIVAADAKLLVESADKVICGSGKFEELIAASQEIAGASAQLVVASRVKADPSSGKLSKLSSSSKRVSEATGNVVATTKTCAQLIDDAEDLDFSKLTLHQAKRLEMDSQVRVLELEKLLENERMKLASLRKQHYHLAGASAGWE